MSNITNTTEVVIIEVLTQETFERYDQEFNCNIKSWHYRYESLVLNWVAASCISELFTVKDQKTKREIISISALCYYIEHLPRNRVYMAEVLQSSNFFVHSHEIYAFTQSRAYSRLKSFANECCKLGIFESSSGVYLLPDNTVRLPTFNYLTDIWKSEGRVISSLTQEIVRTFWDT